MQPACHAARGLPWRLHAAAAEYARLCQSVPEGAPRGTVLRHATPERLGALIERNLRRLEAVLGLNARHHIRPFRIASDVIPFGSHPVNQVPRWDEYAPWFERIGHLIRASSAEELPLSLDPGLPRGARARRHGLAAVATPTGGAEPGGASLPRRGRLGRR
jgi:hypothetical protein